MLNKASNECSSVVKGIIRESGISILFSQLGVSFPFPILSRYSQKNGSVLARYFQIDSIS